MSAHPTAAVEALMVPIREAEERLKNAQSALAVLELRAGQECAALAFAGRSIALTELGRDSMPHPVPGRQALREAVIAEQRAHIEDCRSKLEGLHWKLQQATKAVVTRGAP